MGKRMIVPRTIQDGCSTVSSSCLWDSTQLPTKGLQQNLQKPGGHQSQSAADAQAQAYMSAYRLQISTVNTTGSSAFSYGTAQIQEQSRYGNPYAPRSSNPQTSPAVPESNPQPSPDASNSLGSTRSSF